MNSSDVVYIMQLVEAEMKKRDERIAELESKADELERRVLDLEAICINLTSVVRHMDNQNKKNSFTYTPYEGWSS